MLKCNELMFGDWITDKHGYPMQVTTVGKDYLYADFEDNEGDVFEFDDEDSKPYPVTLTDLENCRIYGNGKQRNTITSWQR